MTTRYCQDCGTVAEPAAVFCATCGARLAAPPEGPAAPQRARLAVPPVHLARIVALATVAALAVLVGGALVLDRVGRPGVPASQPATAPGAAPTAGTPISATPGPTSESSTAARPTAPPVATSGPVASPPLVAAETPVGAIEAYLEVRGVSFAGTCNTADPVADAGSYCTQLVDDRDALQVHWIGPVGSEPDTWLLVAAGQYGWVVLEWAPVDDPAASPPF